MRRSRDPCCAAFSRSMLCGVHVIHVVWRPRGPCRGNRSAAVFWYRILVTDCRMPCLLGVSSRAPMACIPSMAGQREKCIIFSPLLSGHDK